MFKILLFVKRKSGLTPEQFRDRYESGHVPLALHHMPLLCGYVRNYVQPRPGEDEGDYDCMTELSFPDRDSWQQTSLAYANTDMGKILVADEAEFMDRDSMRMMTVDERKSEIAGAP